jgi:hypothetical protein
MEKRRGEILELIKKADSEDYLKEVEWILNESVKGAKECSTEYLDDFYHATLVEDKLYRKIEDEYRLGKITQEEHYDIECYLTEEREKAMNKIQRYLEKCKCEWID